MNSRGRYPPGIGGNRGGNVPNYQQRNPQQYGQRNFVQSNQQFQQQQHWLRRNQIGGGVDSSVEEVEKTVQSEAVDSRYFFRFRFVSLCLLLLLFSLFRLCI